MKQITIRRLTLWLIMVTLCLANKLNAQMSNGLYGNEWIQFDQSYYKVKVSEDGIYRINQSALSAAGLPVANLRGDQFRLYVMGQEVPIFTSTEGVLGGNDYIEFFGRKNRAELDRELFENPDADLLNPEYSLYTDFSSYYLTWTDSGSGIRFQEVDNDLTALPTAETHFNYKQVEVYATNISNDRSAHVKRTINGDGGAYSYFDIAEGFATNFSTSHTMTIEPAFVYEANNNTTLGVRFASDNLLHQQTISLNGTQIFDESYVNFTVQDHDFDIATADIVSGVNLEFKGIDSDVDRLAIANIRLTYPRQFNFGGASSFLFDIERSGSRKYLEIENFEGSGGDVVLYDLTNNIRINTRVEDDLVKVVLPPSTVDRRLVLVNRGAGTTTLQLEAVQFIDYSAESFDYVIITHNKLFDDGQGNNYIRDYADYRRSIQGGGFEVQVVDIAQLYDQFSYGVETHPLSIRNFGHYIDKVIDNPRYVFLIGKGREYVGVRREADKNSEADLPLLIPTFGAPGSDAYLMSDGRDPVPRIPIGRLAANDGREVDIYLRKVKAFEANVNLPQTIEDRAWMKRLIHLGGGGPREQATIRRNLEGMEDIIETNLFGGDVTGFYKSSSDPVQISTSEQIFDLINSGVSIITFFGHSGANTFDFNIDNPDNYKNKNKYPLMLSLGCHIGNIHTHFQGVSERFTFDEDAGAIGFGASSSLGFVFSLNRFTQDYYSLLGGEMYGSSIGDIQKETVARLAPTAGNGMRELLQQFSFHADPALRMNPAPGPDYVVDASTIRFEPEVITSQLDSFKVRFDILNIGKGIQDSMFVEVRQQFPDRSETVVFYQKILAPASRSSLELWVPGSGRKSTGLNKLLITIDENNNIEELPALAAEDNNELTAADGSKGISFYVIDNAVIPVAPRNFSIVNQANPTLIASTSSSIFTEQRFVLEFDTTQLFNSPLKQREVITQKGGLIKWQPQGAMENDRVYYWRVSPDSIEAEVGYIWESSSFVYRPGDKEGWNQSHYYQFLENNVEQININPITRRMEMPRNILELGIENKIVYNGVNDVVPKVLFDFQEFRFMYQFEVDPTINVMVRTPSGKPLWCRPGNTYGADLRSGTASSGIPTFPFKVATEADRIELMEFLENVVQPGQYVMLYTSQLNLNSDLKVEEWAQDSIAYGKNLFSLFEEYGASQVRLLEQRGSVPYVLMYWKEGAFIDEKIADDQTSRVDLSYSFPRSANEGEIISTTIGPASSWDSLLWSFDGIDSPMDSVYISLYAIGKNQKEEILVEEKIRDLAYDLSGINAEEYPYLRLEYLVEDRDQRTPANLLFWRVYFEDIPEAAVNPNHFYVFNRDTLQQGEALTLDLAIENISDNDMDSLLVHYSITDTKNNLVRQERRLEPLKKNSILISSFVADTRNLAGKNTLLVEVNPNDDQAEELHINNFLVKSFYVDLDNENPILDVTFDGSHIIDGDIVSPEPQIVISLKDENEYMQLTDTALFRIYLQLPGGQTERISFTNPRITFFPASGKNKATIEYTPRLAEDGLYQLLVQAEDVTGNQSGDLDYKVNFEVINKKAISNVLNYPNPFSTSTQFVYTLTGSTTPDYFKIQIFTVGGRIVKEITQDDIGPLRIGTHRTEYRWDGTDDFGSRLANGVYLYRIVAKDSNGQDFEHFSNSADRFFKNGFGKLVILR